jgi:hypothetical protein
VTCWCGIVYYTAQDFLSCDTIKSELHCDEYELGTTQLAEKNDYKHCKTVGFAMVAAPGNNMLKNTLPFAILEALLCSH